MDRPTSPPWVAWLAALWLAACAGLGDEELTLPNGERVPLPDPLAELPDERGDPGWSGETPEDDGLWSYTDPGELPTLRDATGALLPLVHTAVEADLRGHIADVTVAQTFRNHAEDPIEVVYAFPLPENAAVGWMRMVIGDRVVESEIKTRATARRIYERARVDGHTAALLEQERPNVFTQSVANIPPGEKIGVEIRYVQSLTYDAGRYEFVFPMVVGPRYKNGSESDAARISPPVVGKGTRRGDDFTIEVTARTGHPIDRFSVPTHEVEAKVDGKTLRLRLAEAETLPNRDFVLRYGAAGRSPRATIFLGRTTNEVGHFLLVAHPPKLDVDRLVGRRELIFVVDQSGSMSGRPLAVAKEMVRGVLGHLRPVDTFNVVGFESDTRQLFRRPQPANQANIDRALRFLADMYAGGGTEMRTAVGAALADNVEKGRNRYVMFMTDGYIGFEIEVLAAARRLVNAINRRGQIARVFAVGIGASPNRYLIRGLSRSGRGLPLYVSNRERGSQAVSAFTRYVDRPLVERLVVDPGSLALWGQHPKRSDDLFASHATVMVGKYRGEPTQAPRLLGIVGDEVIEIPVAVVPSSEDDDVLDAVWARAAVADLEPLLWEGPNAGAEERITRLGLEHHIVTPFTSLVAVDRTRVVSDGAPRLILEPTLTPEDVDPDMAGAEQVLGHAAAGVELAWRGGPEPETRAIEVRTAVSRHAALSVTYSESHDHERVEWEPRPTLLIGDVHVPDGTEARPFKQVVRSIRGRLRRCYRDSPDVAIGEHHRLIVELDARGRTLRVELYAPTLADDVHACMGRQLRNAVWPTVTGRVVVHLRLSAR